MGDIHNRKFENYKNGWNRPMGRHRYNNPYKHVSFKNTKQIEKYDLSNFLKIWSDEKLEKMKSSMDDACLQVDRNVSHEYFSSYIKQLNDQKKFVDNILYKK